MNDRSTIAASSEKSSVWCEGKPWCPVASTAMLLGNKWHSVVLHLLLENQPCRFSELNEAIDGIADKTLADTLSNLEEAELIDRQIVNEKPVRIQYSLTESGEALEPIIREMYHWGSEYLVPVDELQDARPEV